MRTGIFFSFYYCYQTKRKKAKWYFVSLSYFVKTLPAGRQALGAFVVDFAFDLTTKGHKGFLQGVKRPFSKTKVIKKGSPV
jgi:hypothetical protein